MNTKNISKDDLDLRIIDVKDSQTSTQFLNISHYTLLENIPEIISEWWSNTGKDINTFLKDENLSPLIDEQIFIGILLGKYKLSSQFLALLRAKIPYKVTLDKLYTLNKNFCLTHPYAEDIPIDEQALLSLLREIYVQKVIKRQDGILQWHKDHKQKGAEASARYRRANPEKIREYKKTYQETHKEQIKTYKTNRREIENEQQRQRYHADIEKSREKGRLYHQKYRANNHEKIKAQQKKYREDHHEEIKQKRAQNMENEEYRLEVRRKKNKLYHKNAKTIQERKKQRRLQNLEAAKAKERQYYKTYKNKHRDEINAKNRKKYRENLEENRIKEAERQRKYRQKQRFKNVTSKIIMPLLYAIAQRNAAKE